MKTMRKIGSVATLFFLLGCSAISVTSVWKAPDITPKKYNKVMVLGIIREADRSVRIQMENHLVGDLRDLGYNVFSAYDVYGPKMFQDLNEQQAMIKLVEDSIDAVVTIVLLDKHRERNYVPGRVMYSPYITYHRRVWGYYNSMYLRIEEPGYYEETTKYFWESNFYDLGANKLLFSVQTQSFSPSSTDALAHEYGQKIIQSMVKNNVLQKQEEKVMKTM